LIPAGSRQSRNSSGIFSPSGERQIIPPPLFLDFLQNPDHRKEQELSILVTHPKMILENPIVPINHWLHQGFLIIQDAFEGVTNGMEDAQLMRSLGQLEHRPLFSPWIHGILGLQAFYQAQDQKALDHWRNIYPQHPLFRLVDFHQILNHPEQSQIKGDLQDFCQKIASPNPLLLDSLEQMQDCLEAGLEQAFFQHLHLSLKTLKEKDSALAASLALWSIEQVWSLQWDEEYLVDLFHTLFEKKEALRLLALGLLTLAPESSYLLWHRFLIFDLQETTWSKERIKAAREITEEIYSHLLKENDKNGVDTFFLQQEKSLKAALEAELQKQNIPGLFSLEKKHPSLKKNPVLKNQGKSLQLDLFSPGDLF